MIHSAKGSALEATPQRMRYRAGSRTTRAERIQKEKPIPTFESAGDGSSVKRLNRLSNLPTIRNVQSQGSESEECVGRRFGGGFGNDAGLQLKNWGSRAICRR